jgi:hypothetical protein
MACHAGWFPSAATQTTTTSSPSPDASRQTPLNSGDRDLTALELDDPPILTPADAVARLSETG